MKLDKNVEISTLIDYLADRCLEEADEYKKFTDQDFVNITLAFMHVLIRFVWEGSDHLSQPQREELADKTGRALRELIRASTGKDMHILVKNLKPSDQTIN